MCYHQKIKFLIQMPQSYTPNSCPSSELAQLLSQLIYNLIGSTSPKFHPFPFSILNTFAPCSFYPFHRAKPQSRINLPVAFPNPAPKSKHKYQTEQEIFTGQLNRQVCREQGCSQDSGVMGENVSIKRSFKIFLNKFIAKLKKTPKNKQTKRPINSLHTH